MSELAVPEADVIEGIVADPPKPTFADGMRAVAESCAALGDVLRVSGERLRAALASIRPAFHLVGHGQSAKCRICNPRGNPPPVPWAADYRRKTRRRNHR